jgi:hypothetical protein
MELSILDGVFNLGGIAFDPAIRAILVVLTGVVILMGSVYLLLGTNVGARLGFLLAAGGLFGWLTILGFTWWLTPPAIGPRGDLPSWQVLDIVYGDPANSSVEAAQSLPNTCWSTPSRDCEPADGTGTVSAQLLAENDAWVAEVGEGASLSELVAFEPTAVDSIDFGGWTMISLGDAGEAQAAADEELAAEEVFASTADYIVLDAWEQGGKDPLPDDPTRLDRIWHKVTSTAQLTHPTHYAAVQLIPVVEQTVEEGEAPPPPVADPDQPVITVILVRDLGSLRVPGAMVALAAGTMLGVTCYALHRRDKLAWAHRAEG